ncbi:hypothetical protein DFH07DRAFT_865974 [Mycena maculata]|uniref:Uncharacterized protein n=1 Tax=Mycena maculata TaxID=230809 RepID=A0AAD7NTA1_9AGAR|nr:hypothetical protein DFH07DRAFT_865974 [Mycena maculata]
MSYYSSPLADQGIGYHPPEKRPTHRRSLSGNSTSSSDYSSDGESSDRSKEDVQQPSTRRASVPSEGGADRRRLAIVQMDPVPEASPSPKATSAVRARRGLETRLDGLAIIAPPDASPQSYEYLTLPSSAPPIPRSDKKLKEMEKDKSHHRSASETTTSSTKSKASRDVGIVGTANTSAVAQQSKKPRLQIVSEPLLPVPPVFQEPHSSRASSPNVLATPSSDPSHSPLSPPQVNRQATDISVHTPEIGQPKEIHVPVASPVVVDLGPDASLRVGNSTFERRSPALQVVEPRSTSPLPLSSYLHYQPGIHATAGPLPPPPRAIFNIDSSSPPPPRPPRMHSPPPPRKDQQARQLLASVSAVANSSGSTTPSSSTRSISPVQPIDIASSGSGEDSNDETLHRREGAFSPSTISTTPSTSPSDYSPTTAHIARTIDGIIPRVVDGSKGSGSGGSSGSSVASPVIIPVPPPRMESLPEQSGEEWTHVSRDLTASPSSDGHVPNDRVSWESYSDSPRRSQEQGIGSTSPPPKSLKTSLTANLKRFSSLPRTPSPSNKSLARSSSTRSSIGRTPSPSVGSVPLPSIPAQMPRRRKIISRNPPALFCSDVVSRKSAQERCVLYAQKINELYVHDCGLSEWVAGTQVRGSSPSKRATLISSTQRSAPTARHVSRSSVRSEATFPRRPDAMAATDLSTKPEDIAPVVPSLPYPALSSRSLPVSLPPSSMRMLGATSPTSSKTGNFFASLGRKTSVSKKERPNPMALGLGSATTTRLVKSPPMNNNPRPVVIANTPSVPGGPRAPPNRALRTRSIMAVSSPSSSNAARRPSLFTPASSSSSSEARSTTSGASADNRDFERQVDKLADLLPQAERAVLAGYLRRAGQDILAIGQYLEDEKHGTLRSD